MQIRPGRRACAHLQLPKSCSSFILSFQLQTTKSTFKFLKNFWNFFFFFEKNYLQFAWNTHAFNEQQNNLVIIFTTIEKPSLNELITVECMSLTVVIHKHTCELACEQLRELRLIKTSFSFIFLFLYFHPTNSCCFFFFVSKNGFPSQ